MKELVEVRFNDNRILLKDNYVRSPILPQVAGELDRDIVIQGECIIDGAVFARNLEIQQGPCRTKSAVFAHSELHVNSDARGDLLFEKAVGAAGSIVSLAPGCRLRFLSDLTAKEVRLRNAYVSGSIFADTVALEDCVVLGGVFGTNAVELNNCIVGTFNAPAVRASRIVYLLFPSAFSVEMINMLPGTQMFNLALADLGAHMRGVEPLPNTGKIAMDLSLDELKAVLTGDGTQQIVRTYSVAGKVLAADLLDLDRLQNHFLISCASLGNQLLRTCDLGPDKDGLPVELTSERFSAFFFDLLDGKIEIPDLSGEFDVGSIVRGETPVLVRKDDASHASPPAGKPEGDSAAPVEPQAPLQSQPDAHEATLLPKEPPETTAPLQESAAESAPPAVEETPPAAPPQATCRYCNQPIEQGESFCGFCGKSQQ